MRACALCLIALLVASCFLKPLPAHADNSSYNASSSASSPAAEEAGEPSPSGEGASEGDGSSSDAQTKRKYDDLRQENAVTEEEDEKNQDVIVGKIWLGTLTIVGILLLATIFIVLLHRINKHILNLN